MKTNTFLKSEGWKQRETEELCYTLYIAVREAYRALDFLKNSGDKQDWKSNAPLHPAYNRCKKAFEKAHAYYE